MIKAEAERIARRIVIEVMFNLVPMTPTVDRIVEVLRQEGLVFEARKKGTGGDD